MSEQIRYESAERVRDFYRNQGAKKEQERIVELLEQARDLEQTGIASWLGLQSAIMLIKGESQKDNETVVFLTEGEDNA